MEAYFLSGINLSFATLLVENGCNVLIADLALRPEAQVLADKHKSGPGRIVFQETNVIDWAQLERMFEVAEKEFGVIDIVCPGAGVYEPVRIPEEENQRDTKSRFSTGPTSGTLLIRRKAKICREVADTL